MKYSCLTVRVRIGIEQLRQLRQCQRLRVRVKVRVKVRVRVRVRHVPASTLRRWIKPPS